ncbi:hypothetical protein SAMN05216343_1294 [Oscillibacter sp. PC13]|nr:hypothetical protein SAMN05216343_1294 [Oscillibacter sp. PC13]
MDTTWKDELVRGLQHFGGEAHRKELFDYIGKLLQKILQRNLLELCRKS